ncbi:AT-rich interactive domain-containing protein 5A isoform X2 [Amia ocellicauda]
MEVCDSTEGGDEQSTASLLEVEEKNFMTTLYKFMKERNTPIERIPHLGFKQINLWKIYKAVEKLGGYDSVTARRLWKNVYDELGGSPGSTSAATCTRRHYERLVLPFERHLRGEEDKPLPPAKPRKQYKTGKDCKGKKAECKRKKNEMDKEGEVGSGLEDKKQVGSRYETGTCLHTGHRLTPSDNPKPDLPCHDVSEQERDACPAKECAVRVLAPGNHSATICPASHQIKNLLSSYHSTGRGVISPLVKKKLIAQASEAGSLSFSAIVAASCPEPCPSPDEDSKDRPSVIHCAQVPELQAVLPSRSDSSEGSPEPPSTSSSSPSPSACSITSEDCLSQPEDYVITSELERSGFSSIPSMKPLNCYPTAKESNSYSRGPRGLLQVSPLRSDTTRAKGQQPDLSWSPGCKMEEGQSTLKSQHPLSSASTTLGPKACWVPPIPSSFNKVLPKTSFLQSYKLPHALKRPAPEDAAYGKKFQMVPPLPQGEPKEKNKPGLPKPVATHSLMHHQGNFPVSYFLPAYDRTRTPSANQLKGLHSHFLNSLPAQLALPTSHAHPDLMYRQLSAGGAYPVLYDSTTRTRHYPFPIWHPQAGYAFARLQPLYPNTKL